MALAHSLAYYNFCVKLARFYNIAGNVSVANCLLFLILLTRSLALI